MQRGITKKPVDKLNFLKSTEPTIRKKNRETKIEQAENKYQNS